MRILRCQAPPVGPWRRQVALLSHRLLDLFDLPRQRVLQGLGLRFAAGTHGKPGWDGNLTIRVGWDMKPMVKVSLRRVSFLWTKIPSSTGSKMRQWLELHGHSMMNSKSPSLKPNPWPHGNVVWMRSVLSGRWCLKVKGIPLEELARYAKILVYLSPL